MNESCIITHHIIAVFAYQLTSCLWQRILSFSAENGRNPLDANWGRTRNDPRFPIYDTGSQL